MRILILLCSLFLFSSQIKSQDTLIKRSNEKIIVKVIEVNASDIRYKRFNFPDGPLYTISKSEVKAIVYSNGVKESFENSTPLVPVPVTFPTNTNAAANLDLTIEPVGNYYFYRGQRLSDKKMFELVMRQKNPKLNLLIVHANKLQSKQYGFGIGGLAIALVGGYTIFSGISTNTTFSKDREQTALILAEIGLACEVVSLCYKIERTHKTREVADAYNKSISK